MNAAHLWHRHYRLCMLMGGVGGGVMGGGREVLMGCVCTVLC